MTCRCAYKFLLQGLNIYSPIVYQHSLQNVCGYIDRPTDFWLSLDFGILRQASGMFVLMLQDWDKSIGVEKEIEFWSKEVQLYKLIQKRNKSDVENMLLDEQID